METLVKIRYNKKFEMYEALTAASHKGVKLQKFGNDWNITGANEEEVYSKVSDVLSGDRLIFVR